MAKKKNADSISVLYPINKSKGVFDEEHRVRICTFWWRGIDPNLLPHILEGDFKRSVGSSEDKKRNMGIGLSVCSTIISAHEGKMRAYNGQNGGAVFEFTLPLDMAEMELYDYDEQQEDE